MRGFRSKIAVVAATLLALSGAFVAASPAVAAYEELRPGAESPTQVANGSWKPGPPDTRIAQQFLQPETGHLATMSIGVYELSDGHQFTSASIHAFEPGVGPSPDPIPGGEGGTVTYTADPSIDPNSSTSMWATVDFPNRPLLEEGERYALVINPLVQGESSTYVSFALRLFSGSAHAPWVEREGSWSAYATGNTIFSSELADAFAETAAPKLADAVCDAVPEVIAPVSEGVEYTIEQGESEWNVSASAIDGYEMAPESEVAWTLPYEVEPCDEAADAAPTAPTVPKRVETASL